MIVLQIFSYNNRFCTSSSYQNDLLGNCLAPDCLLNNNFFFSLMRRDKKGFSKRTLWYKWWSVHLTDKLEVNN